LLLFGAYKRPKLVGDVNYLQNVDNENFKLKTDHSKLNTTQNSSTSAAVDAHLYDAFFDACFIGFVLVGCLKSAFGRPGINSVDDRCGFFPFLLLVPFLRSICNK